MTIRVGEVLLRGKGRRPMVGVRALRSMEGEELILGPELLTDLI